MMPTRRSLSTPSGSASASSLTPPPVSRSSREEPRNQLCPVERVAKQQTSYPKSEHGDVVGIKVHLFERSAQGLKVGRIGGPCFDVLAGKRYLKQYEENHNGNKNSIDYPGSKVSDGNALAVLLLEDREHQYPVSCVANDGHQPEKRGYCYQHAVCRDIGKGIRSTKNGQDEYIPPNAYSHPRHEQQS